MQHQIIWVVDELLYAVSRTAVAIAISIAVAISGFGWTIDYPSSHTAIQKAAQTPASAGAAWSEENRCRSGIGGQYTTMDG